MKILVIGDIFIDKYTYGKVDRLAPDFTGFVFDKLRSETFLGGAANVALGLNRLLPEIDIVLMGCLKPYEYSYLLNNIGLISTGDETMIKERIIAIGDDDPENPRLKQKLIRIDSAIRFPSSCGISNYSIDFEQYDYIIFSDYNKGTIDKVPQLKKPIVYLDSKRKNLQEFTKVNVVKVNDKEFELSKDSLLEIEECIVTHGKKPVSHYINKIRTQIPTYETLDKDVSNHDFSGAGDSFLCGLIYAHVTGYSRTRSIRVANINAALAVSTFGTAAITKKQLEDEINTATEIGYL